MLLNCGVADDFSLEGLDAEAETPIIWPPHAKSWLVGKDPDAEKDSGRRRRG